jgi:competence protein ComEA
MMNMWEAIKKYDKRWYILLLAVFIAVVAILFRNNEMNEKEQGSVLTAERMVQEAAEKQKEKVQSKTIVVDIKGAVVRPGVYEITDTARVNDVVGMAGGFTKEADQTKVNLAAKVHDEMMIYVPARGKTNVSSTDAPLIPSSDSKKVHINTASEEEILQLSGIGPTKAAAIIAYREEHGPFKKVEDLLNVTGIGEKTLEKIKEQIVVP